MTPVARLLAALALAAGSLVVAGAAGTPAYACSCIPPDLPTYVDNAEAVFTGTVTDRAQEGRLDTVVHTVSVDQVYKGEPAPEVTLSTAGHEAACGLPDLPRGEPLLFFGSLVTDIDRGQGEVEADYAISLCGGTGPTDDRELAEVERLAGPPREPTAGSASDGATDHTVDASAGSSDPTDDGLSPLLVAGAGIGALVLAVLVGVLLRRSRG